MLSDYPGSNYRTMEDFMNLSIRTIPGNCIVAIILPILLLCFSSTVVASYELPKQFNPSANYLFFFHNYYVEKNGPNGDCKYYDILSAFADQGYTVISDLRPANVQFYNYIEKATSNIEKVLAAGVPPEKITVAGHSKGGIIVIQIASRLKQPRVKYAIFAGCGIQSAAKAYPDFTQLEGTFLSLYAENDTVASSCRNFFAQSANHPDFTESVLHSTAGHRLFFTPERLWLEPAMNWIQEH